MLRTTEEVLKDADGILSDLEATTEPATQWLKEHGMNIDTAGVLKPFVDLIKELTAKLEESEEVRIAAQKRIDALCKLLDKIESIKPED